MIRECQPKQPSVSEPVSLTRRSQSIKFDVGNRSISIVDCYRLISAIDSLRMQAT